MLPSLEKLMLKNHTNKKMKLLSITMPYYTHECSDCFCPWYMMTAIAAREEWVTTLSHVKINHMNKSILLWKREEGLL
jgi:Zn-finger protein